METTSKRPVLAYDVEPANKRYRLRLARYRYQSEALSNLLPEGPSQVLDAGCGRGRLPMYWKRWGRSNQSPEFTGFDYLQDKLDRAQGKGYSKLLLQDITQPWNFPDASFDVVICEQVLEHLGDKQLQFALSEMNRVLKPGGSALIGTPVFKTIEAMFMPLVAPINHWLHQLKDSNEPGHEQHLTLRQLKQAISAAGFTVTNARGFRVATLPRNWLENYEWYYNIQQWLGSHFPGWCVEATLTAKKS